MQIQFERDLLLKPIALLLGFVERKHTMPILSNIYINKIANQITMIANDMEIQATIVIDQFDNDTEFAITVPAKKFQDILKSIKLQTITLEILDGKIVIRSGNSRFMIHTMPIDNYPLLTIDEIPSAEFSIKQSLFKNMLMQVHYAMATADTRIFLNGVLLEIKHNTLYIVATDAHRLCIANISLDKEIDDIQVIIPRKTVIELQRLLDDDDFLVNIKIYNNQVFFAINQKELITKILDAKYPDYERVIPLNNDKYCLINRSEFLESLHRVSVIGIDKLKSVTIIFNENLLNIKCKNEDQEDSEDALIVEYRNETLVFNFNMSYLLDVLSNLKCEYLECALSSGERSVLFTIPQQFNFKYVLMPLRG